MYACVYVHVHLQTVVHIYLNKNLINNYNALFKNFKFVLFDV